MAKPKIHEHEVQLLIYLPSYINEVAKHEAQKAGMSKNMWVSSVIKAEIEQRLAKQYGEE